MREARSDVKAQGGKMQRDDVYFHILKKHWRTTPGAKKPSDFKQLSE